MPKGGIGHAVPGSSAWRKVVAVSDSGITPRRASPRNGSNSLKCEAFGLRSKRRSAALLKLANRGHLQEAYAADRRLLLDPKASHFSEFLDPFLGLALLGVIPESLTATTFRHALEPGTAWPMPPLGTARQLRGLPWWLARGDTVSLAQFELRAAQETRTQESARGKLQGRYLHAAATAYVALARADSVLALRLFQSIPDTLCLVNDCFYEKLIEARLLASRGQARQAGAVLDRWVWSGGGRSSSSASWSRDASPSVGASVTRRRSLTSSWSMSGAAPTPNCKPLWSKRGMPLLGSR